MLLLTKTASYQPNSIFTIIIRNIFEIIVY